MAKVSETKIAEVQEIKSKIEKAKAVLVIDYKGLTVAADTKLRAALRQADVEYKVLKNTMVRRAFNELGNKDYDEALNGPTAIAFGYEDEAACAKAVYDQGKQLKDLFNVKAAYVDGQNMDLKELEAMASLPSRDVLLAQVMATLNAPMQKLAATLKAYGDKLAAEG